MKKKYTDFFESIKEVMSEEDINAAKRKAITELMSMRLAELREKKGINQTQMNGFSQPAISKLENRDDFKISTLIEYLEAIGMSIEIIVHDKDGKLDPISLLKN